jgi:glycosyltransferase involved in cell wall biosynthesis
VTRDIKPRLLILTSTYPRWPCDPEPGFVHELAKRLTCEFEVTVVGPHSAGALFEEVMDGVRIRRYRYGPEVLETLVNDGGIVTNLKRQPWKWLLVPGFILGLFWSLWSANRQVRPDVIHTHWLLPQGLAAALLSKMVRMPPFLVTSHGADLFALKASPFQLLKRFVVRRAAAVTVVSTAMRNELARIGVDISKVSVQPMGVDLSERFTPGSDAERSFDEILFVGRFVEKKGLRHLIEAMPVILKAHPSAKLTIVGFGPEATEREMQVRELALQTKIKFVGAVPQTGLATFYRRAAVFVAPFVQASSGDQEGLGLVVVEAVGCGCPLVISDLPAVGEVLAGNIIAGMVPPGSVEALENAISDALSQRDQRIVESEQLRSSLQTRFDWKVVTCNYANILRRLATRQPAARASTAI